LKKLQDYLSKPKVEKKEEDEEAQNLVSK